MDLMIGLQNKGYYCEFISLNRIGTLGPLLTKNNIPVIGLPHLGKGGWRSYFKLRHALRTVRADVLIMTGHHLLTMLMLGKLCKGKRILKVHFHHTGVKPLWQWRLIYWIAKNRFQSIEFPSDFIREEAEELYPPIKSLTRTVRNTIARQDIPTIKDKIDARQALGIPQDAVVIGNAGWLIPRKRFDIFLQVAHLILKHIPSAIFVIAGDGEERYRLETLAQQLEITAQVKWLGWQENMTQFYHSLDLLLFNSNWEAMGLTPLEAMSYGIPLVASVLHGGLKEIVNKEEYGFLISTHDVNLLAEKAIYFLQNPHVANRIAMKGRDRVDQVSNYDRIVEDLELELKLLHNGRGKIVKNKNSIP
jgi:glycosyltransferase involved in cell wall biosynthesis